MHFIGMLAFVMPMPAIYEINLTILSLFLSVFVVGAGLYTVSRFGNGSVSLLVAGLQAGLGLDAVAQLVARRSPQFLIKYPSDSNMHKWNRGLPGECDV